jgi:hypothetical protein
MPARTSRSKRSSEETAAQIPPATPRELVVITKPAVALRAMPETLASLAGADVTSLSQLLQDSGATLVPIFGPEERVERRMAFAAAPAPAGIPALSTFYSVQVPEENMDKLAADLMGHDMVLAAYIQPPMSPPVMPSLAAPAGGVAPPTTPDFTPQQLYLDPAPGGIDARYAWTLAGGKGQGVQVIDIEGAWRFSHEDLLQNQGGVIGGTPSGDIGWRNHGTAVAGEFSADENGFGVTGIAPLANVRAISVFAPPANQSPAKAITDAANALNPGDIILIELHAPGPRFNFQGRNDQLGYIAMEWWPANFAAILYATSVRGVIVVEAGGNGAENLDDPLYSTLAQGFPANWTNPFNLANPQSGAIIVGAGAPPPGTHGRNHGADRSRLGFSNFGARVDVQGWGREVTTAGYGDLQGPAGNEDLWYTDQFSGTSSASPIIVGTVASLQGALRGANKTLLTPATARNLLRSTGSPQQDEPGRPATQRIGNRPDLRQALVQLGVGKTLLLDKKDVVKEIKEKDVKEIKDAKDRIKDVKDKEKEKEKEKEFKELKEFKEKDTKDIKDIRDRVKIQEVRPLPTAAPAAEDVETRLSRLEAAVADLAHFITAEQRPDLQASALAAEPDLAALSQELQKQATDAKAAKDNKDVEKLREA